MLLIDSHCHLHYDYAPKQASDLIAEAHAQGIDTLVTVGTDPASFEPLAKLADAHPRVYFTAGIHPHEAEKVQDADLELIRRHAVHPKCVAIGEIGLDYYYEHSPREPQLRRLNDQLQIATELGKPIVIHSRLGEDDLLAALTPFAQAKTAEGRLPGVIHCFTGSLKFGEACLALGFRISFSGILTFKNAEDVREAARSFPLERLLVETDSPYLAPIPFRGKKCEPAMVRFTAQKLAEIKRVPLEEVARATYSNTCEVFGIPPSSAQSGL